MIQKGLIHIYTGEGKGKTTAALGLCFRAAGWGIHSAFIQFMKGQETGEFQAAEKFGESMFFRKYGSSGFIKDKNSPSYKEHLVASEKGFKQAKEILKEKRYSIVVLDEILNMPAFGLLHESEIIELIEMKPEEIELVLTGRGASPAILSRADLVTEMKEIKHYFESGVIARKGIEY